MADATIGFYNSVSEVKEYTPMPLSIFLEDVRSGRWQDIVIPVRCIVDKKERDSLKKRTAPCVTISGEFAGRNDAGLIHHSGFMVIDSDDVDPVKTKETLSADKYVFAVMDSISGRGTCSIWRVMPEKHVEAFKGIQEYLHSTYNIPVDPTGVNPSRARFITYDPHLYLNENAQVFKQYSKDKPPKKVEQIVFAQSDFDQLITEIHTRGLNIAETYHDWLRCGFAIAHKFGESGRQYFHAISTPSDKYNSQDADRQYSNCLKAGGATVTTIATFYHYCKQIGLSLYSQQTKVIMSAAVHAKKGGRKAQQAVQSLQQFEAIPSSVSQPIVEQVFQSAITDVPEESEIEQIEQWLRHNYDLRRNEITRYIENRGTWMKQQNFNTIFIAGKKIFDKMPYDLMERLINSDATPTYNPLIDFFRENDDLHPKGNIEALFATLSTDSPEYALHFGRKWLVGMIAGIHGKHNPLMLVLSGTTQNTGKTEFFRRLLPDDWHKEHRPYPDYLGESKLDAGKDDEILMTQKVLILDDEMSGKSKADTLKMKTLLSRQTFSLREPYGKNNVDLLRIATLCGTSNETALLNDPTGNRRLIPVSVYSINHEAYNKIDKRHLIMEAYQLYKLGFDWKLNREDISQLAGNTEKFENYSTEYELITKYFQLPQDGWQDEFYTATDISIYIESKTNKKLTIDKIGKEMTRLGFSVKSKKRNGASTKMYTVNTVVAQNSVTTPYHQPAKD